MPNHIKNRLEFMGKNEDIQSLFDRFNTHVPEQLNRAYNSSIICINKNDEYDIGWFNEETGVFKRRNHDDIIGMPDDYEFDKNKAFDHFPDFDKIIPIPESLEVDDSSTGDIGMAYILKQSSGFCNFDEVKKRFENSDNKTKSEMLTLGQQYIDNLKNYGYKTWYDWSYENWGTKWNSYSCEKLAFNIFTFETAWSCVEKLIEIISKEFHGILIYTYADEDTGSNCGRLIYSDGELKDKFTPKSGSKEAYELAFELRPNRKKDYQLIDGNYEYVEDDEDDDSEATP